MACFPATAASTGAKKHPCRPSSQRQTIASPFQLCTYSCGRAAQVEPQLLEQFFPHRRTETHGRRALSSAVPHQLAKHSTSARTAPTARSCTHTTAPTNPTASTQGTGTTILYESSSSDGSHQGGSAYVFMGQSVCVSVHG